MIINIGVDIFFLNRINNKTNKSFIRKILSNKNIDYLKVNNKYLAKIFSIKESLVKSIGTGFRSGLYLQNLIINNNKLKKPTVYKKYKNKKILLTISHEKNIIITIVIILNSFKFY